MIKRVLIFLACVTLMMTSCALSQSAIAPVPSPDLVRRYLPQKEPSSLRSMASAPVAAYIRPCKIVAIDDPMWGKMFHCHLDMFDQQLSLTMFNSTGSNNTYVGRVDKMPESVARVNYIKVRLSLLTTESSAYQTVTIRTLSENYSRHAWHPTVIL